MSQNSFKKTTEDYAQLPKLNLDFLGVSVFYDIFTWGTMTNRFSRDLSRFYSYLWYLSALLLNLCWFNRFVAPSVLAMSLRNLPMVLIWYMSLYIKANIYHEKQNDYIWLQIVYLLWWSQKNSRYKRKSLVLSFKVIQNPFHSKVVDRIAFVHSEISFVDASAGHRASLWWYYYYLLRMVADYVEGIFRRKASRHTKRGKYVARD